MSGPTDTRAPRVRWHRLAAFAASAAIGCASAPRPSPDPEPEGAAGSPGPSAAPAADSGGAPLAAPGPGRPGFAAAAAGATPRALFERAVALSGPDPAAAAALFDEAFRADPSLVLAAYDAGVLYERLGDLERARDAYGRALAAASDFQPASLNLTRLRIRAGQAEEAEADLRARVAAHPESTGLHDQLVEVLLATGRLDAAEQEARRILKSDEHDVPAMVALATVYYRKGRQELARVVLENARQVAPDDPVVWNRLGFVELQVGTRAQAMEHFRKAAELDEAYPEAQTNYGAMLVETEAFPDAVRHLELAVRNAPQSAAAQLNLGNAYRGAKEFEKAESAYQRALEIDPALVDAWFDMGLLYLDGEKPGLPAAARLERAIALLDRYAAEGGADPKLSQYRRDASTLLEKERKRLAREERDRLRKEAEARRREEEEARLRAKEAAAAAAAGPAPGSTAPSSAQSTAAATPPPAATPSPTADSAATPTPAATATPIATPSPTPAATATPSSTPTATSTPVPAPTTEQR